MARQLGIHGRTIGGAFVSLAGALPPSAIVVNRCIGLGLERTATDAIVDEIVAAYSEAGVRRFFVHLHARSAPTELAAWLQAAGLERARSWQKFERGIAALEMPATALEIWPVGREHGEEFARIACNAFDLGEAAIPWLAELPGRAGWHVFMSFEGERPAGTGAIFVREGLAWLDFGATAPEFRRRGSQAALLAHRVRHARELGCRRLYTCTGEAVPGDAQHSYRNILKAGFRETRLRENYAPLGA